ARGNALDFCYVTSRFFSDTLFMSVAATLWSDRLWRMMMIGLIGGAMACPRIVRTPFGPRGPHSRRTRPDRRQGGNSPPAHQARFNSHNPDSVAHERTVRPFRRRGAPPHRGQATFPGRAT